MMKNHIFLLVQTDLCKILQLVVRQNNSHLDAVHYFYHMEFQRQVAKDQPRTAFLICGDIS